MRKPACEGLIQNPSRPTKKIVKEFNVYFVCKGRYTFVYVKTSQSKASLLFQGQTIASQRMAYKIGQRIQQQKTNYIGRASGLKQVRHLIDLCYIPDFEKFDVIKNILEGAKASGNTLGSGILFINE
jgi:hypothetical protein